MMYLEHSRVVLRCSLKGMADIYYYIFGCLKSYFDANAMSVPFNYLHTIAHWYFCLVYCYEFKSCLCKFLLYLVPLTGFTFP